MSTLLKAGDSEPEQPLREGWLVKQSGGASNRARRRSVGEIMKKWDERYFVLTTQRLYYFKTMEVRSCCPFCRAVSWANAPLRDPRGAAHLANGCFMATSFWLWPSSG